MSATIVRAFQTLKGLRVDGIVGPMTMSAAEDVLREHGTAASAYPGIPHNRRMLEGHPDYGKPSWTPGRGRLVDIDDRWESRNIRVFTLHTGQRRKMHRLVGDEFVRLFEEACRVSGYTPESVQTYNPRRIGGTQRLSMHAYGIAVDFDPSLNPWGARAKLGGKCPLIAHPAFLQVFRDAGWTCGADWRNGDGDWMHAQRAGV